MQIGDTKSFKKAVITFFIVIGVLQVVAFGSFYLGCYGFTLAPFVHGQDGLWWHFYQEAETSAGGGMAAAVLVYFGARRKQDEKSKPAA